MRKQALWCRASRLARRRSAIWRFVNYCVPNFWNHLFLIIWAPPSPSLLFKHRGNAGPFCIRQCLNYRAGEEPQCLFRRSSVQKLTVNANISKFEGRLAAKNTFKISNIHTWTMTWTYHFHAPCIACFWEVALVDVALEVNQRGAWQQTGGVQYGVRRPNPEKQTSPSGVEQEMTSQWPFRLPDQYCQRPNSKKGGQGCKGRPGGGPRHPQCGGCRPHPPQHRTRKDSFGTQGTEGKL